MVGVQAAGKSTVADLLAREFESGVHVRGGRFYRWAVRGWVHPGDERSDEARRLLSLRYTLSARVADEYCAAGFSTVVQDDIFGEDVLTFLRDIASRPRHLVVRRPSLAVLPSETERGAKRPARSPTGRASSASRTSTACSTRRRESGCGSIPRNRRRRRP